MGKFNPNSFAHFSKGERNGVLILFLLIIILIGFNIYRNVYWNAHTSGSNDSAEFLAEVDKLENPEQKADNTEDSLFYFDPNLIGISEWQLLGFSKKQAQSIENYKSAGAKFYKKEDLLKLYVVDEFIYNKLAPYVEFKSVIEPNDSYTHNKFEYDNKKFTNKDKEVDAVLLVESSKPIYKGFDSLDVYVNVYKGLYSYYVYNKTPSDSLEYYESMGFNDATVAVNAKPEFWFPVKKNNNKSDFKEATAVTIELNSTDTTLLKTLKGIGSSYAARIIKYRNILGGYSNFDQLHEVYGMTPELHSILVDKTIIDASIINKININNVDAKTLKNHPYINWNIANSIVNYRNLHGSYVKIEDIKKSKLINHELFVKLVPYLSIE